MPETSEESATATVAHEKAIIRHNAATSVLLLNISLLAFTVSASACRLLKGMQADITANRPERLKMRRQGFRGFSEAARHPDEPHPFRSTPLIPLIYRPVDGNSEGNKCITRYLSVSEADGIKSIHPTIHPIPPPRISTPVSESPISP